jgi:D-alanyl-D-alanine carboxypeptidase (penicillin-binding protein 5/6)
MTNPLFRFCTGILVFLAAVFWIDPAHGLQKIFKSPYVGAIVMDAATGRVTFEDHADAKGYPASMIKLMNLLIILEGVRAGHISLDEPVTVSARVSKIGGSQVYLKEKEVFSIEELIYAMMVQSANDAALALATHYTGSEPVFVELMNKKARELGMENTKFYSVHGLPPSRGEKPDVTTARDMALLSRELVMNYPEALKYTSTKVRKFRLDAPEPFVMRTHNHLLKDFEGCDGLKTGYFYAAGFSIAATAQKSDARAIAVVLGSSASKARDKQARFLLSKGLMDILLNPPDAEATAEAAPENAPEEEPPAPPEVEYIRIPKHVFNVLVTVNIVIILVLAGALYFQRSAFPRSGRKRLK